MHILAKTELIDFERVSDELSAERKESLLDNLASLFAITHASCTAEQLETYDNVLLNLVEMVAEEARAKLAEILAPLPDAPSSTVRRLAGDTIRVARPVLMKSPVLDDIDLRYICETHGDDHMLAISERDVVNEPVSDAIIARAGNLVLRSLAANPGARISGFGFKTLLDRARPDEDLQEALATRADFPSELVASLAAFACERVRDKLGPEAPPATDALIAEAGDMVLSQMCQEAAQAHYDFAEALSDIEAVSNKGLLSVNSILEFANDDRFAHVVWAHSRLTGLTPQQALADLTATKPTNFIIAARAHAYSETAVTAVMTCGPWKGLLSPMTRMKAAAQFRSMSIDVAARLLTPGRKV